MQSPEFMMFPHVMCISCMHVLPSDEFPQTSCSPDAFVPQSMMQSSCILFDAMCTPPPPPEQTLTGNPVIFPVMQCCTIAEHDVNNTIKDNEIRQCNSGIRILLYETVS